MRAAGRLLALLVGLLLTYGLPAWAAPAFGAIGGKHVAGYDANILRVVVDADAGRTEAAWEQRLPGALAFLFGE